MKEQKQPLLVAQREKQGEDSVPDRTRRFEGGRATRTGRKRGGKPLRWLFAFLLLCVLFAPVASSQRDAIINRSLKHAASPVVGPFVSTPLNPDQVDALRHLMSHMTMKQLAALYVSRMTLDEEIGQLIMAEYYMPTYGPDLDYMIHTLHVGGVIMYAFQMTGLEQTQQDIAQMQHRSQLPLIIATDEEGGFVERVQNIFGDRPGALQTYETGNPANATKLGDGVAHDLALLGINTDLAPDVDVQLVDGPDQYLRTWGYTPQSVITYGGAYLRAIQGDGIIGCIKHFPGLGAAKTDAHFALPVITRTRDQIYATELAPFKYFVQSKQPLNDPGMVMSTDLLMPAIDPVWPAELSHTFITGILRDEFGYDGVVITDALWMTGIAQKWNLGQAAVLALQAGDDMLLGANGSYQVLEMINAIKAALQDGQLTKARIDQSATRIIALKLQYHLFPPLTPEEMLS
ncbi:MAG TPA: glycoside hydrolase family 3 N-terminal domain-containing protein [Ktedonobacteraceae bacterium]|nr:glycoside hydrolase family 3 N-terminal domain-containing protein [Ktedonobacteraceae bacterium]